jgi:DNA modification methylase
MRILHGNNIELLKSLPDNSIDAVVTDPFMGSGTTGIACKLEGFDFVGMEQDENYHKIAISRIENYLEQDEKIVIKVRTETETTEPKKTIIQSQLF